MERIRDAVYKCSDTGRGMGGQYKSRGVGKITIRKSGKATRA